MKKIWTHSLKLPLNRPNNFGLDTDTCNQINAFNASVLQLVSRPRGVVFFLLPFRLSPLTQLNSIHHRKVVEIRLISLLINPNPFNYFNILNDVSLLLRLHTPPSHLSLALATLRCGLDRAPIRHGCSCFLLAGGCLCMGDISVFFLLQSMRRRRVHQGSDGPSGGGSVFAGSFVCQVQHGFIGASSFCGCCCGWFCMFGSSHGLVGGRLASLSPPQIQMRKSENPFHVSG